MYYRNLVFKSEDVCKLIRKISATQLTKKNKNMDKDNL